ncbi:MAG: hypothetical protein HPY81_00860 [Firmicutes bacterium]|nr:hypothetical protein [Bacillota bacterium]
MTERKATTTVYIKTRTVHAGSDSVELLTSIMMRYPEVGTINFEPARRLLKFTFILSQVVTNKEIDLFREKLVTMVDAYNHLEGREPGVVEVTATFCKQLTLLEISRDIESLDYDEIALLMAILHQQFGSLIMTEESEGMLEEEILLQEDLIRQMLESLRCCEQEKKLVAFREEGRVLVFNK